MKVLIIHATKLTERAADMRRQLDSLDMDYEFVTKYDKEELTEDVLDKYFVKGTAIYELKGAASCAMKHLLACQYIVERGWEGALILEDDIQLHRNFKPRFEQSIREFRERYSERPVLISYEDSTLTFVPRSERRKGQMLYPAVSGRYTGAFFISSGGAKVIIETAEREKCHLPIDGWHTYLIQKGVLECLWCQPAIATQGSFTGLYTSAINQRRHGFIKLRWYFKLYYKRLLYYLR